MAEGEATVVGVVALVFGFGRGILHWVSAGHGLAGWAVDGPEVGFVGGVEHETGEGFFVEEDVDAVGGILEAEIGRRQSLSVEAEGEQEKAGP